MCEALRHLLLENQMSHASHTSHQQAESKARSTSHPPTNHNKTTTRKVNTNELIEKIQDESHLFRVQRERRLQRTVRIQWIYHRCTKGDPAGHNQGKRHTGRRRRRLEPDTVVPQELRGSRRIHSPHAQNIDVAVFSNGVFLFRFFHAYLIQLQVTERIALSARQ